MQVHFSSSTVRVALAAAVSMICATSAQSFCFEQAGERYGIAPELLRAIARVESSLNPAAVNATHEKRTGSVDLGLMQINSRHLSGLAAYGITREALMADACLNVMVGAWILNDHLRRHGEDWNGIGSYNAACTQLKGQACTDARNKYAWKVYRALRREESGSTQSVTSAAAKRSKAAPAETAIANASSTGTSTLRPRAPTLRSLDLMTASASVGAGVDPQETTQR